MSFFISRQLRLVLVTVVFYGCGDGLQEFGLPERPVFADVQELVFDQACSSQGCHDVSAAGQLDLSTVDLSRTNLVDVPATNTSARGRNFVRVKPGRLDESFLYHKVTSPGLGEGAPMPLDRALTQPYVELIERWIEQGAR